MPLQATSGAASYDAFGGGVVAEPNYIESVFSTYLYSGTGASQTITNGIDLSTKGGLTWIKARTQPSFASNNTLFDTIRGTGKQIYSDLTSAQATDNTSLTAFNATGFTLGTDSTGTVNYSGHTFASWTFRKQPKFFDCVTYTGDGSTNRSIAHNLQSMPGFIIVKRTDSTSNWYVAARLANSDFLVSVWTTPTFFALNSTGAAPNDSAATNVATDSVFYLKMGGDASASVNYTNINGASYVAYLFAHNAGGFGLTGTDNVISCGSFTGSINGFVDLGFEPQWVLVKKSSGVEDWQLFDNMRGMTMGDDSMLNPNTSGAENNSSGNNYLNPQPTGFTQIGFGSGTFIYIAIRRGPMKVPTSGTSVFGLSARSGTGANATVTGGQTDDAVLIKNRGSAVASLFSSRLTGTGYLVTSTDAAEVAAGTTILQANPWDVMDGVKVGTTSTITNASANTYINYLFKRAPSFFDVVCYTGTGSATTFTHNLGVVPELMIVKTRTESGRGWAVYAAPLGATKWLRLELTNAEATASTLWNNTAPTSSVFTVGTSAWTNNNTQSFVNYLFATCAGVSKVFSYTGNGSSQTINCGFTSSARFVLIKRTDSTGDWYVWDTARGIVSGNDSHLSLNTADAEVTTDDTIDTDSTGFVVNQVSATNVNVSSATYIGLAIA